MTTEVRAVELPVWVDPEILYLGGPARRPLHFWLDAGPEATHGWSFLGEGDVQRHPPRDVAVDHRSDPARTALPFRGGWVGWLGYDDAARRAGAPAETDERVPADLGMSVRRFVAIDHASRRQWAVAPDAESAAFAREVQRWAAQSPPGTRDESLSPRQVATARHTPAEYAALIEACRHSIAAGDAYQLCLTTRFSVAEPVDPVEVYQRLRRINAAPRGGIIAAAGYALISSSPEQFLDIADGTVRTRPIKGTRPRGRDAHDDARLADELQASAKEQAENVMIVDLMRNDLQRVCTPGSVTVERLLEKETYPTVHQLVSTIAGTVRPGVRVGDVLDACFPAGSMTGAPKLSAMTILHRLEAAPRGVYAGCFGWIGRDGSADLAMTIRSIVCHPGGAYVGAGGGITWASDAQSEVEEVGVKARAPLAALGASLPAGW